MDRCSPHNCKNVQLEINSSATFDFRYGTLQKKYILIRKEHVEVDVFVLLIKTIKSCKHLIHKSPTYTYKQIRATQSRIVALI